MMVCREVECLWNLGSHVIKGGGLETEVSNTVEWMNSLKV